MNRRPRRNVKTVLLRGIFWRILIIEAIVLVGALVYRFPGPDVSRADLLGCVAGIAVIGLGIAVCLMVALSRFLEKHIIGPLETIAEANRKVRRGDPSGFDRLPEDDLPEEIAEIMATRNESLSTIMAISEERLKLVNLIRSTFGRYLSDKVVDQILDSPDGGRLGGRRKTVTLVMSDLRGFTRLSEDKDPEELLNLLNGFLARMSDVILGYDGVIDEVMGDGLLIIFGAPEDGDDDPGRAVACALAMQNALRGYNQEIAAHGARPLEMGVAVNTGPAVVGNIGSEKRMKYGAVGRTINICGRIESDTVGGQVLIGPETYQAVADRISHDGSREIWLKGVKRPITVYSVNAIGAPYNVALMTDRDDWLADVRLPFTLWEIEDGLVKSEAMDGETLKVSEHLITAIIDPPLEPMTDVKLDFSVCLLEHCFEDVYAKVVEVEPVQDKWIHRLRITSAQAGDVTALKSRALGV